MIIFGILYVVYFFVVSGIVYDIIIEPPSIGTGQVKHSQSSHHKRVGSHDKIGVRCKKAHTTAASSGLCNDRTLVYDCRTL